MMRTPSADRRSRPRPGFQPRVEVLEDRLAPAAYSGTELPPPSGDSSFDPVAISASGQVAGVATVGNGSNAVQHVALYSNGQSTDLSLPSGYTYAYLAGINDAGQVLVGGSLGSNTLPDLLEYSNGQWNNLSQLAKASGFTITSASGIDNAGDVLADAQLASGATSNHILFYSKGTWSDLGAPSGVSDPFAQAINSAGQALIGGYTASGVPHEYLYSKGQWTDLGTPPSPSEVIGDTNNYINDAGQVAVTVPAGIIPELPSTAVLFSNGNGKWVNLGMPNGNPDYSVGALGIDHSGQVLTVVNDPFTAKPSGSAFFLYSNGQWNNLNSLVPSGITLSEAEGINDSGQIIATDSNGQGVLLTPVQALSQQATATTLTVSSANVPAGQSVTLTVTVADTTANANTPVGSVTFLDGSSVLGTATLSGGQASLTAILPVGSHSITAQYSGVTVGALVYGPSTSQAQTVTVTASSPAAPADRVAADALMVVQGLESANINLAFAGMQDFLALLSSSPPVQQPRLLLVFFKDFFRDLHPRLFSESDLS